jgi:hypothetical protein
MFSSVNESSCDRGSANINLSRHSCNSTMVNPACAHTVMVNCGVSCVEAERRFAKDGELTMEETIAAISEIFPNNLSRSKLWGAEYNSVVLTSPLPNMEAWEQTLPEGLKQGAQNWFPVLE